MARETIFDLFNEQHANDNIVKQPETLPGIVRPTDVNPDTIPGEKNASSSSLAATATTPPAAAAPTAVGGDQGNSEPSENNNSNKEGGRLNEF